MTRIIDRGSPGVIAVLSLSALVAFELRGSAPSVDSLEPLHYRGELRAADGLPIMGAHVIGVELWDAAHDGKRVCTVSPQAIDVDRGQFDLELAGDCADAFGRGRGAWAELVVDGEQLAPRAQLVSPRLRPTDPQDTPSPAVPSDVLPSVPEIRSPAAPEQAPQPVLDVAGEPREAILCI